MGKKRITIVININIVSIIIDVLERYETRYKYLRYFHRHSLIYLLLLLLLNKQKQCNIFKTILR